MDDRDLERWAEEGLRTEPEPIRAPAGFADRVMARVTTTAIEPSRTPAWFLAASDPIVAVGLTAALVLALAASWWPGRILGAAALVSAWAWNVAASLARDLDPTALLALLTMSLLLIGVLVWGTWRATERALILVMTGRRRS